MKNILKNKDSILMIIVVIGLASFIAYNIAKYGI